MTRMFSVVSRCTSDSSSQGWFFSCHAFSVSRAENGGACRKEKMITARSESALLPGKVTTGGGGAFTFRGVVREEALKELVLDGKLLRRVVWQDVFVAHVIQA